MWGCHKIGVPLVIIHFHGIFHYQSSYFGDFPNPVMISSPNSPHQETATWRPPHATEPCDAMCQQCIPTSEGTHESSGSIGLRGLRHSNGLGEFRARKRGTTATSRVRCFAGSVAGNIDRKQLFSLIETCNVGPHSY